MPENSNQEGGLERENENNMHRRAIVTNIVLDIFKYISSFNYQWDWAVVFYIYKERSSQSDKMTIQSHTWKDRIWIIAY